MLIKSAEFVKSSPKISECPSAKLPEYAFIGRSNVGKSSLINMLTGRNKLAKISSRPGKTQLINHFLINENWYLVDLPGYGWAKVSKKEKARWKKMIEEYLLQRENLDFVFLLIDSRHEPQAIDLDFLEALLAGVFQKVVLERGNQNVQLFGRRLGPQFEQDIAESLFLELFGHGMQGIEVVRGQGKD